jgi:RHS repeat-associated protein
MKKNLALVLLTLLTAGTLSAYEYTSSGNVRKGRAAWMVSDGNTETAWQLAEGETDGFIEIKGSEETKSSVLIDCDLPGDSEIQLYSAGGKGYRPVSGAVLRGAYKGSAELHLPGDSRASSGIRVCVSGKNAAGVKIKEIAFEIKEYEGKEENIKPASYFFNLKEEISMKADRLWDGKTEGPWFEPLWYIPWDVSSEKSVNRADEIFGGTGYPSGNAQIVWNLDGKYAVNKIRVFVLCGWRSIKFEAASGDTWTELGVIGPSNLRAGDWNEYECAQTVTDKIRITFPGGWEQARFITEAEVYGVRQEGQEKAGCGPEALSCICSESSYRVYEINRTRQNADFKVCVYGTRESAPDVFIDDSKLECVSSEVCNGNDVYTFRTEERELKNEFEYLSVYDSDIESVLFTESYPEAGKGADDGIQLELWRPVDKDGAWNGSIVGWTGNSLDIVTINGRAVSRSDRMFWLGTQWIPFEDVSGKLLVQDRNGLALFEKTFDVKGGDIQKGGKLLCGEQTEYTDSDTYTVNGTVNSPYAVCSVNGSTISVASDLRFKSAIHIRPGYQKIIIKIAEGGKTTAFWTKEIVRSSDSLCIETDCPDSGISIRTDTYELEGRVSNSDGNVRIVVNGSESENNGGRFRQTIQLEEGRNEVKIKAVDGHGRTAEKTLVITKDTTAPEIKVSSPENNSYMSSSSVKLQIDGGEEGLWYSINGSAPEFCSGSTFEKEYELADGTYDWTVTACDDAQNVSKPVSVHFTADVTPPEEFEIVPRIKTDADSWQAENDTILNFKAEDAASGIAYYEYTLDGQNWTVCESPLELSNLQNGKTSVFVRAVDRCGNIRLETTDIYTDTSAPEEFELTSDAAQGKWTNNSSPVLYFETTDSVSGIKKYTLRIDSGTESEWKSGLVLGPLADGKHSVVVRAYDYAGNFSAASFNLWTDSSRPENFKCSFDVDGWTNNTTPQASFSAEDAASGTAYYELSTDGGDYVKVTSPYTFSAFKDGTHSVKFRITDNASNVLESPEYTLYIDATPPAAVSVCRLIPGNGTMQGVWQTADDDILAYHIIWNTDGTDELITQSETTIKRSGIKNSTLVKMSVQAEDRAHNYGPVTEAVISATGLAVKKLGTEATTVEYENIKMTVPYQGDDSTVKAVLIQEVQSKTLLEKSVNPVLSPIYSFTTLDKDGENLVEKNHEIFAKPVSVEMHYDDSLVPAGYPEGILDVYYYNEFWGKWFKVDKNRIDTENNVIYFTTSHFTDFAIQPTLKEDFSAESLKDAGHAYGNTESKVDDVTVSLESGTMMTDVTEMVIKGKNGFEFPIKRVYDTQTARSDSPMAVCDTDVYHNIGNNVFLKSSSNSVSDRNAQDTYYSLGVGWRLSIPYMYNNTGSVYVKLPDGSSYSTSYMKGISFDVEKHVWVLENHFGEDFTLELIGGNKVYDDYTLTVNVETVFLKDALEAFGLGTELKTTVVARNVGEISWTRFTGGKLIMKDGTSYYFDRYGRTTKVTDSSGDNSLEFSYNGLDVEIVCAGGTSVKIEHDTDNLMIDRIISRDETGNERCWEYKYDNYGLNPVLSDCSAEQGQRCYSFLVSGTDPEGRLSEYGYTLDGSLGHIVFWSDSGMYPKNNTTGFLVPCLINRVKTPGGKVYDINYKILTLSIVPSIEEYKILPDSITAESSGKSQITSYIYECEQVDTGYLHDKYFISSGSVDDGRTITTSKFSAVTPRPSSIGSDPVWGMLISSFEAPALFFHIDSSTQTLFTTGEVYETTDYTWDETYWRILKEEITHEGLTKTRSYDYDDWGNKTEETVYSGTEVLKEKSKYYGATAQSSLSVPYPYPDTEEQSVSGCKNLLVARSVYDGKGYTYTANAYDSVGRNVWSGTVNGDHWAAKKTSYYDDSTDPVIKGRVKSTTSPSGQITEYTYEHTDSDCMITAVSKDVPDAEGNKTDITTSKMESLYTGRITSEADGNGNTTYYTYDKIGRLKAKEMPGAVIDDIVYDDTNHTISVYHDNDYTKPYEIYYYDGNSSLTQLEKCNYSTAGNGTPGSISAVLGYDEYNRVVYFKDWNGNRTQFAYDQLDRLEKRENADGSVRSIAYDNNVRTTTDENGGIIKEVLDFEGKTKQETKYISSMETAVTRTEYDGRGRIVSVTDPLGRLTSYEYSVFGDVSKITKAAVTAYENGAVKTVVPVEVTEYNDDGLVFAKSTGSTGNLRTVTYSYDGLGRLLEEESGTGKNIRTVIYGYDNAGNRLSLTDGEGNKKTWTYTVRNMKATETDACGNTTSYEYDRNDNVIKMTDPRSFSAEYSYNDYKRLIYATVPEVPGTEGRGEIRITYDANGNALSVTAADGKITQWEYDSRNHKISETQKGGAGSTDITKSWTYDRNGNALTETTGSAVTKNVYDEINRLIKTTKPDGETAENTYDKAGRITLTKDSQGYSTSMEYNSLDKPVMVMDALHNVTTMRYNVWGDETVRTSANNTGSGDQTWDRTYNDWSQVLSEKNNAGQSWSYEYDKRGLTVKAVDPNGTETDKVYDKAGRETEETKTNGTTVNTKSWTYDESGFMYAAYDNGVATYINYEGGVYTPNAWDAISSYETETGGRTLSTAYTYDRGLRPLLVWYPDGQSTGYAYNGLGQLTGIEGYASNGRYDNAGHLTQLFADDGSSRTENWDAATNLLTDYSWNVSGKTARTISWDTRGNITGITKDGYGNTYTYDALNRLVQEQDGHPVDVSSKSAAQYGAVTRDVDGNKALDKGLSESTVRFDYYASSIGLDLKAVRKVTKIELTGKSRRINKDSVEVYTSTDGTESRWTKAEGITFVPSKDGTTLLFAEPIEAQYLKVHSICDERDEEYEPVDKATVRGTPAQLVEVYYTADGEDITWTFDARGNRLTEQKYAGGVSEGNTALEYYDYSDLIKSRGTWQFNYDKNGNMISRGTDGTWNGSSYTWASDSGELWEYGYDLSNRLISVKKSAAGTDGLKEIAAYVYDIRGLRVESIKTGSADEDGSSATDSGTTTYYQYGLNGELLWTDDGTTQEKYIYARATIWAEVLTTDGESATYYHHTDHTGTTECITDAGGTVVWDASYEAYGKLVHENGTVSFKASFTGKQIDEDTGLYYFNARWYDADLGRFVTEDPARDGTNWYEYCKNNPLKYMDPTGLDDEEINKKNEGEQKTETSTSTKTTTDDDDDDDDTLKVQTTSTTTSASSSSSSTTDTAPTVSTINTPTTTQDSSNGQTAEGKGSGISGSSGKKQNQKSTSDKVDLVKEFADIFTVDVKCGLGLNVSFISELGIDLYSQQAHFSSEGYKEETTSSLSLGIINVQKTCEGTKSSTLLDAGKIETDFGPFQMNGNSDKIELDMSYSVGFQIVIGVNLNISGKESLDFVRKLYSKIEDTRNEHKN